MARFTLVSRVPHHLAALIALITFLALPAAPALAQPFNVRAWYAQGQVFVVWQIPAPPALPTDTIEIYASATPQPDTSLMDQVGRVFFPECTGGRLNLLVSGARLLIPTPPGVGGGTYRLAADEGVFVYTPHAAGSLFFAVVNSGSTTVVPGNSAGATFSYDPVNEPIRPHPQFDGFTPGGYPYTAYVLWADGRADPEDDRPDIPVLANAAKNGVPHVFTVTRPVNGLPPGAASCLFAMHGGGGEYQLFRPGLAARANMSLPLSDGIVVTPDDSFFARIENSLERMNTSWFGYTPDVDPFDPSPRTAPPDSTIVVNYTQRRVHWILDWLLSPQSPYLVDPTRVAMVGHSGGGRGTSHLTRLRPERFCAAVVYTPPFDLPTGGVGMENFLRGTNDQNLASNVIGPAGAPLGVSDIFLPTTRISAAHRDIPLTRVFFGKRDTDSGASWSAGQRAGLDAMNDTRLGYMILWDEREHGVELWSTETPGLPPDIGQWVVPDRTERARGQYLVDTYRNLQTYPGFSDSDHDPATTLREPDPGPGDPNQGEPWGTWAGYFDWETATLVDEPGRWEATVFAVGLSAVAIDNCPVALITTSLTPRMTQSFNPPAGAAVSWTSEDDLTGATLQSGTAAADHEGVVTITGLTVPRDPDRIRIRLINCAACPADANCDGTVNSNDISTFLTTWLASVQMGTLVADFNGDNTVNSNDISAFLSAWLPAVIGGC